MQEKTSNKYSEVIQKYDFVSTKLDIKKNNQFDLLVIDPPWQQGKTKKRKVRPNQTEKLDYPTLTFDEIKLLPIPEWSAQDALIFLWVTNSKEINSNKPIIKLGFDLLDYWGFKYHTIITWDKKTGPCPFSPFQITTEHILFGYRGKLNFDKSIMGKLQTCFTETSKGHSVKPNTFYSNINKYFKGSKIDIFARKRREGFVGWGDEYNKEDKVIKTSNLQSELPL